MADLRPKVYEQTTGMKEYKTPSSGDFFDLSEFDGVIGVPKTVQVKLFADDQVVEQATNRGVFMVPTELDGYKVVAAAAYVTGASTTGDIEVQVVNISTTEDILSTIITIEESGFTSYDATDQPVINTDNDDLQGGDLIGFSVLSEGDGATGLGVSLTLIKE